MCGETLQGTKMAFAFDSYVFEIVQISLTYFRNVDIGCAPNGFLPTTYEVPGKVMFSLVSVILFTRGVAEPGRVGRKPVPPAHPVPPRRTRGRASQGGLTQPTPSHPQPGSWGKSNDLWPP